jgi:predicted secreted protein
MSISTQGCTIRYSDMASPEVWADIVCITSISGPDGQRQEIDKTCLDSVAREFEMGIRNEGSVQFDVIYDGDEASHTTLYDDFQSASQRNYRLVLDDSPEEIFSFAAFVSAYQFQIGIDDVVRVSVTLRITGAVTDNN